LGGEEFGAVLRDIDAAQALAVAEDLRRRINALRFSLPDGSDFNVTASIGIGALDPKKHRDGDALYREVDSALYKAKAAGRNRVVAIS
jgi:diguanylate cyclase (GGDEF)-like protein